MQGRLLNGRYRLMESIGAGGMGEVWRALDEELGRQVAVKIFAPPVDIDEAERTELLARFRREARAVAALDSPHIVTVFDHGTAPVGDSQPGATGVPYLVMQLLTGRSLQQALRAEGRIPLGTALDWAEQICRALEVAHTAGVVHRDIKPANIMVGPDGTVQVLDFGVAAYLDGAETASRLTRTGQLPIGSVLYMAPEQFRQESTDGRVDLYALGCVLYELLVSRPPFVGPAAGVMYNHLHDKPLLPSRARAELTDAVDRLILSLMAKEPADRPRDAETARLAVERVRRGLKAGLPSSAAGPSGSEPRPEAEPSSAPDPPDPSGPGSAPDPPDPPESSSAPDPPDPPAPAQQPHLVRQPPISSASSAPAPRRRRRLRAAVIGAFAAALGVVLTVSLTDRGFSGETRAAGGTPYTIAVVHEPLGASSEKRIDNTGPVKQAVRNVLGEESGLAVDVVGISPAESDSLSSMEGYSRLLAKYPGLLGVVGDTRALGHTPPRANLPTLSVCDDSTTYVHNGNGFTLLPHDDDWTWQLARNLASQDKLENLLVMTQEHIADTSGARQLAAAFEKETDGGTATISTEDPKKTSNAELKKVFARADAMTITTDSHHTAERWAVRMKEAGFQGPIIVATVPSNSCIGYATVPDPALEIPDGVYRIRSMSHQVGPEDCWRIDKTWCKRVRALPDRPGALEEYEAASSLLTALKTIATDGREIEEVRASVITALRGAQHDTLLDQYRYDADGRPSQRPLWLDRAESGQWKQIGFTLGIVGGWDRE
ncbi:serine/threonine-protein kinase [Streptomyces xiangluensis]|uniref:non-specific serine/threonine protein kinase n=1 Tax=Streptomyces xiangluensis TaxID=2665720 RepID=A0ABV8YHH8_9ACTN